MYPRVEYRSTASTLQTLLYLRMKVKGFTVYALEERDEFQQGSPFARQFTNTFFTADNPVSILYLPISVLDSVPKCNNQINRHVQLIDVALILC